MPADYYIGLMSGTSLDGVDAALIETDGASVRCVADTYLPYSAPIREAALALHSPGSDDLHQAAVLGNTIATLYSLAVRGLLQKAGCAAEDIRAIGAHGQTVRHNPAAGYTLQLLNPALLAERTGITVVADFRSRDIAAGGQGAPLVPAFHDAMLRSQSEHRIVLNIGGIANLTNLAPGRPTIGFDTGPGNMLLDAWVKHCRDEDYDENGDWASTGSVDETLLQRLMSHPFLQQTPPKSCGREEFNLAWLQSHLSGNEAPENVQATLTELTARTIADAIYTHCAPPDTLLVCGGGARNAYLMHVLGTQMPESIVTTTDKVGIPGDWLEAMAFAWLASRTLARAPGNLPEVTGAKAPRILGAIYLA